MAMNTRERKARQRATPAGYAKSRQSDWRQQGIAAITYQEYLIKLEVQHHQCGICGTKINGNSALDHDHKTGNPRGLLCSECNLMLGKIELGGSQFLMHASAYLALWGN